MLPVVVDSNVLVSALLSPGGKPAEVLRLLITGALQLCFDSRIVVEYEDVLSRPKFSFDRTSCRDLMSVLLGNGISVAAEPLDIPFADEDDKKFYEVAKQVNAKLITGNLKHFPEDPLVTTVADFLAWRRRFESC